MTVLSKPQHFMRGIIYNIFANKKTSVPSLALICLIIYFIKYRNNKLKERIRSSYSVVQREKQKRKQRGRKIDWEFIKRILRLAGWGVPSVGSVVALNMLVVCVALVLRTLLSIKIAGINGKIVAAIIQRSPENFTSSLLSMVMLSIPSSVLNSYISYLIRSVHLRIRANLTRHFHRRYINGIRFYQLINIDNRVRNPDQIIAKDIDCFAEHFALLFSELTKPALDIILFGRSLGRKVGYRSLGVIFFWYGLASLFIKFVSPPMSMLRAL